MEPYPECAKKQPQPPPSAQQVLQALFQRERTLQNVGFNEFKSFDQLEIEKYKLFEKYGDHGLPRNAICII